MLWRFELFFNLRYFILSYLAAVRCSQIQITPSAESLMLNWHLWCLYKSGWAQLNIVLQLLLTVPPSWWWHLLLGYCRIRAWQERRMKHWQHADFSRPRWSIQSFCGSDIHPHTHTRTYNSPDTRVCFENNTQWTLSEGMRQYFSCSHSSFYR